MGDFDVLYASRQELTPTWSSIEVVITGTTGNRVYPKRVPRVQIPPAPPEQKHRKSKDFRCFSAFMAKLTGINVIYQAI